MTFHKGLVDWHTNLWLPEHLGPQWEEMGARAARGSMDADPAVHKAKVANTAEFFVVLGLKFDRLGIHVPHEYVADYCREMKGRAVGFAGIDPLDPESPRQLERAVRELGLRGVKFSPVYSGFDPWCREAGRIYALADKLGVPILWHQSAAYARESTLEWGNPILIDKIAREFPKLKMILAHVGQPWTEELVVLLRKHKQLFSDLSARFHRKWQLYNALMVAHEYGITDRLLFGSDFPIATTAGAMAQFRALNDWGPEVKLPRFPDEVIEDILFKRPLELVWAEGL